MRIAVSVESTNDLSKQLLLDNDIKVISYQISLGDAIFKDGDKTTEEIFEQVFFLMYWLNSVSLSFTSK